MRMFAVKVWKIWTIASGTFVSICFTFQASAHEAVHTSKKTVQYRWEYKGNVYTTRKEINKQTRKFALAYVYSSLRINAIIATHVCICIYISVFTRLLASFDTRNSHIINFTGGWKKKIIEYRAIQLSI